MYPISSDLVTWKRATAFVLDSVAVGASHSSDRNPVRAAHLQVRLNGSPTGTVTVGGTVDGSPGTEVLTWAGDSGFRMTRKQFSGAITFTVSQSGGTTIECKAVGAGGDVLISLFIVKGPGHPVSFEVINDGGSPARSQGSQEEGTDRILVSFEEVWKPRKEDRVVEDRTGDVWVILKVEERMGALYPEYWACRAKRLDGKGTA